MNCLEKLVGLDNCVQSDAPFLINDIGIDRVQMEEFMDASYQTVEDFFAANLRTAARLMESDIYSKMPHQMQAASVLEGKAIGNYPDLRKTYTGSGIAGIRQDIHNDKDYLTIRINKFRIFSDHDGDITVKVWNLTTGEEVGSETVTLEAGKIITKEVEINIPSPRQDLQIFVGFDTTGIDLYNGQLYNSGCCGRRYYASGWCQFFEGTIESPFIQNTFESQPNSPGLSYEYEIVCDNLSWLCNHKTLLGMALNYKTAIAVLENAMDAGGQFSNQKTTNYEKNANRLETYTAHYNDQIIKALRSMRFPKNRCFSCESITHVINKLPG